MELSRNKTPLSNDFNLEILGLRNKSSEAHLSIIDTFSQTNALYNEAAAIEDSTIRDFLSLKDLVDHIPLYSNKITLVQENFLNSNAVDKNFPVSSPLNIDVSNGILSLPPLSTNDLTIKAVVIDSESNGTPGNYYKNNINNDLNLIFNGNQSNIFEYEKYQSLSTKGVLYLSFSVMLDIEDICNALFIKLFSENGVYAELDVAEISLDGSTWTEIYKNKNENKPEIFIRFEPQRTRYIRMRFVQNKNYQIGTGFGYKNRLLIGLREITPKKIEYTKSGEFVSTQILTKYNIKQISFDKIDNNKDDIKYQFSINNGTKWNDLVGTIDKKPIHSFNLGVLDNTFINSIRIKVSIDKSIAKTAIKSNSEYFQINTSKKYRLERQPKTISCKYGNTISFGELTKYVTIPRYKTLSLTLLNIPYSLIVDKELILHINGISFSSKDESPMFKIERDNNPDNTLIVLTNQEEFIANGSLIEAFIAPERITKPTSNTINLSNNLFYRDNSKITVKPLKDGAAPISKEFIHYVSPNTIKISDIAFISDCDYEISYIPEFDLFNDSKINYNIVSSNVDRVNELSIRIDYTYEEALDTSMINYYSPYCDSYQVTLYA